MAIEKQVIEAVLEINERLLDASRQNVMRRMKVFSEDQCYTAIARAVAKGLLQWSERHSDGIHWLSVTDEGLAVLGRKSLAWA